MTEITGTTVVTASISPTDTVDELETHRDEFGKGGFRAVDDYAARDGITDLRRTEGMWVHVLDNGSGEDEYWTLQGGIDNVDWTEVVFSGGGGVDEFTQLTDTPNNYSGQDGKFVQVDEGANELIFVDSSGGVETWIPLEGVTPAFLEFLLSDNGLLTDVASGQLLTFISPTGNPAAAGTAETFTLSGTEQGFYVQLTDTSPQDQEGGYFIFTDNVSDWWTVGGVGSGVFYQWDSNTVDYAITITFGDGGTFDYSAEFHHPDILDREICISTFIVGDDITCNVYINDGANTVSSPPTFTFTQTLQPAETPIMEAGLVRVVNTLYSATGTNNYRSNPNLQYTAVTQYVESGSVDPASYPADRNDKLFMVTGLAAPLISTAGIIDNGYAVGFDDVGFLKTRTVDADDTVFDLTLDYTQEGKWAFLDRVTFDGAVELDTPLFSKDDDLFQLQNHTRYNLVFTNSGSSLITMDLPTVLNQSGTLFPFVDIFTSGKDKSVDIITDDNSNFFIDGVDSGSDTFNQTTRQTVRYIKSSVEGQSNPIWQVISFGAGGGGFDDTSLINYTSSAGINLSSNPSQPIELSAGTSITLSCMDDINISSAAGDVLLQADPTAALGVATKQYVDNASISNTALAAYVAAAGISLTAALNSDIDFTASGSGTVTISSGTGGASLSSTGNTLISGNSIDIDALAGALNITSITEIDLSRTGGASLNVGGVDVTVGADPTTDLGIATKQYVDNLTLGAFEDLGASFLVTGASFSDITALTTTDIAYSDTDIDQLRTYRFDEIAGTWSQVGNSLAIGGLNTPRVTALTATRIALWDTSIDDLQAYDFDGTNWTSTGADFLIVTTGSSDITALDSSNIVHIDDDNELLQALNFNGAAWSTLGNSLSVPGISVPKLATLDSTHIILMEQAGDSLTVYEFNNPNWSAIGTPLDITNAAFSDISAISPTDIILGDSGNNEVSRYHWDGSIFSKVGTSLTKTLAVVAVTGFLNGTDAVIFSSSNDSLQKLRFTSDDGFDANSLQNYNANYGIEITAAEDFDINFVTSGTGDFLINGSPITGFTDTSLQSYVAAGAISLTSTAAPISFISAQGVNITAGVADGVIVAGASLQVNSTSGMNVVDGVTALEYTGNAAAPTIITSQSGQDINITSVLSDMTSTVPLANTLQMTNGNVTVDMTSSGVLWDSSDTTDSFVFDISTAAGFFASNNPLGLGGSHLLGAFTIGNQQVVGGATAETATTLGSKTSMTVDSETVLTTGSTVDLRISETGGTVHASMIMAYDGTAGGGTLDLTSESDMSLTATNGNLALSGDITTVNADPTTALGIATKQYVDSLQFTEISAATYTVLVGDEGIQLIFTNVVGCVVTIPTGLGSNFNVIFTSDTVGDVSFVGGATLRNLDNEFKLEADLATATLLPTITTNTYNLIGRTKP